MRNQAFIAVIIPVLNEEQTIGQVLDAVPSWVDAVVVADNGSSDRTPEIAGDRGALVTIEPRRGYGSACLAGMREAKRLFPVDGRQIAVFLDGDLADDPQEMARLVDPISEGQCDLALGSRLKGRHDAGALTIAQKIGNRLACRLIALLFGVTYSDLGPFRAIDWTALERLGMDAAGYGFTVQMQVRAARQKLNILELPVAYRRRAAGRSKVSGTLRGICGAGATILYVIFSEAGDALFRGELRNVHRMGRRRPPL